MQSRLCTTTCPYCGVGCGVEVIKNTAPDGQVHLSGLSGQNDHPANFGKLCVKGSHLLETNGVKGRLASPSIKGEKVDWDTATAAVANAFKESIEQHGPESVALYVSGQLLTEDYYVANKFMKGYVGSANIDTNSRLCMSSAVAAYKRAFGSDTVPCNYQDIEQTDLFIMVGSNAAWTHPILFQRVERAKRKNPEMRVVCIDPRQTMSCELADLHLAIKPGSDAMLFNGLLHYLHANSSIDQCFINDSTEGFEAALSVASEASVERVSEYCGISVTDLEWFYARFAKASTAITFYSMGVNQSTSGVDKANAIINCHLASGKIGKPGCGPFSITGQPNAMGGREVGGLANMLAAHMDIENAEHRALVQEFWQSPTIAQQQGLKAVDMFDAIESGKIKVIWIMATNPVVSMPNRNKIEAALAKCPTVIVSDIVESNDTLAFADICLPATGWSEKDGTVTNSERRISRQRGLLTPYAESRHDWQIISAVAQTIGFDGFDYAEVDEIFREHAALSGYANEGSRDFDISGLAQLSKREYNDMLPVQWPVNAKFPQGTSRMFTDGRFYTPSQKAQFIPIQPRLAEQATTDEFPLSLNTGRLRDQWHTMTRTGKAAALNQHTQEPTINVHPDDAKHFGIIEHELVEITANGIHGQSVVLRCELDSGVQPGQCFAPIHFNHQVGSSPSVARLFNDARDPISGQPELKHASIAIKPLTVAIHIEVFSVAPLPASFLNEQAYWSVSQFEHGYAYRIASHDDTSTFVQSLQVLMPIESTQIQRISTDSAVCVSQIQDTMQLLCMVRTAFVATDIAWIDTLFSDTLSDTTLTSVLRDQPDEQFTLGSVVCSCFQVRQQTIKDAITAGHNTVASLGEKLKCGTNCGSCKSELSRLIQTSDVDRNKSESFNLSSRSSIGQQSANTIAINEVAK